MANNEKLHIEVTADTSKVTRGMDAASRELRKMELLVQQAGTTMEKAFSPAQLKGIQAYKAGLEQSRQKMAGFKLQQMAIQGEFMNLASSTDKYGGNTKKLIGDIEQLGLKDKKAKEAMINNDKRVHASFYRTIGAVMARSSQASAVSDNFARMKNPIYSVNKPLLGIANGLDNIAKKGSPAVLALKMLGPTASMKDLQKMQRTIAAGQMRLQGVFLVSAVAAGIFYTALHKGAMDTNKAYAEAFKEMSATVREAVQPLVDVFATVMTPIFNAVTAVGKMVIAFNEAHPTISKVIAAFLLLIPALTLILSPLAVGIGLFGGFKAAMAAVWMIIGPTITGFAAMMGTVLLVAGAIVLIGVALWALWTKTDWFKGAVLAAWEAIKTATITAWNWLLTNAIMPALTAINAFITQIMGQVQTFWAQNGQQILAAGKNVWSVVSTVIKVALGVILAIMQVVWPIVKSLIVSTWNAIKSVIQGAINIILGIIKIFSSLFTGDWKGVWEGAKQLLTGIVQFIIGYVQLTFLGGIMKGVRAFAGPFKGAFTSAWTAVKSAFSSGVSGAVNFLKSGLNGAVGFVKGLGSTFYNAGKGLIDMMAKGISAAAGAVTKAVSSLAKKARDFLPFSPAKEGPLSDLDKLDFGGPIGDSLVKAMPKVEAMMTDLVTIPSPSNEYAGIAIESSSAAATTAATMGGISIGQLHVREEADVEKIAVKLFKMQQSRMRAMGGRN